MARCLLALGSNLGRRDENLARATRAIAALDGCQLLARSSWHETTPIGGPAGQGAFLNGSLLLETSLAPSDLSSALHEIERRLGRERVVRWDARLIDIDVLLYDRLRLDQPELTIPHPRLSFRRFVLEPAGEIAGGMLDPVSGWTLAALLRHLDAAPRYVAVAAASEKNAERLAGEISRVLDGSRLKEHISPAAIGADADSARAVELAAWRSAPALAAWLPGTATAGVPPAVAVWPGPRGVGPALTIAWDVPDQEFRGPVARLAGDDIAAASAEALAAVRAAWPQLPEINTS